MNTQLRQSLPRFFLDEPIYRLFILPSFVHPFWRRRILLGAIILTIGCVIAAFVGSVYHLCDKDMVGLSVFSSVFGGWFAVLLFFPLFISLMVRPMILIQERLFQAFFNIEAHRMYRFFGIFSEVFAFFGLYAWLIQSALVVLGVIKGG